MKFSDLLKHINSVHHSLQTQAVNAVNQALTVRNWLIGYYIVEYEQNGEDRAAYGGKLLAPLAKKIKYIKGVDERSLRRFRQFYQTYPQLNVPIRGTLSPEFTDKQINSLYYERSGLSAKPEKLAEKVQKNSTPQAPTDIIKNIYAFEFLNLKAKDVVEKYINKELQKLT